MKDIDNMNAEELITQVDEQDNVIGLQPRSRFFGKEHLIHRSSYLIVINSNNELLLQQRALSKQSHAGKWTFPVAGTVADESYDKCVRREVREAFGKEIPFTELIRYRHFDDVDRAFKVVYIAYAEKENLSFNTEYAHNFAWIPIEQLEEELVQTPEKYAPPFLSGMKTILKENLLIHVPHTTKHKTVT